MITKSFLVRVGADTKDMQRGLKSAEARMKKFNEQITKVGKGMMIAGAAIIGALTMITKKASDAQETFSKFGTVFSDSIIEAEKAANELTKSYGLSMLAAKDMLSATGDLLTGLGLQGKTALNLSRRTQKLSVDLASFTNYAGGAKGASEALTKAMLGERESVKALGIVISEEMVKEQLLKQGKEDLTGMALLQAKAEATLTIAVMQSKNAIGDYERTSGDLANVVRRLVSRLEDLWVIIGTKLIPVTTTLATKITAIVERTKEWTEAYPVLTSELTKGVAVLGGTLFLLGGIGTALPKVVAGFMALKKVALILISPIGALAAAIAGIVISVHQMVVNLNEAKKAMSDFREETLIFQNAAENFKKLWIVVRKEGGETLEQFDELFKRFGGNWDMILRTIIKDPKFATLKILLFEIATGLKTISLEGEDLSIKLPEQFKKAADISPFTSWATTVAKIFHDVSVRAGEMKGAIKSASFVVGNILGDLEKGFVNINVAAVKAAKLPPFAVNIPKMSLKDLRDFYIQWLKDLKESWKTAWQAALDGARDVLGALNSVFSQFHENEATRLDNEEKKRTDAIESWYEAKKAKIEATIMDEEAKVAALEALDEEKARKENKLQHDIDKERRKLERKRAKAQKVGALFAAGINIAEAITKALAQGGFLLGAIFSGVVAALGAIQVAAIAAAPLPSLQKGGFIERETVARLHPGEFVVNAPDVRALTSPRLAAMAPAPVYHTYLTINAKTLDDNTIRRAAEKIRAAQEEQAERYG